LQKRKKKIIFNILHRNKINNIHLREEKCQLSKHPHSTINRHFYPYYHKFEQTFQDHSGIFIQISFLNTVLTFFKHPRLISNMKTILWESSTFLWGSIR